MEEGKIGRRELLGSILAVCIGIRHAKKYSKMASELFLFNGIKHFLFVYNEHSPIYLPPHFRNQVLICSLAARQLPKLADCYPRFSLSFALFISLLCAIKTLVLIKICFDGAHRPVYLCLLYNANFLTHINTKKGTYCWKDTRQKNCGNACLSFNPSIIPLILDGFLISFYHFSSA